MARRRVIQVFSISFLDLLSGALGAVIILFIAVPKAKTPKKVPEAKTNYSKVETKKKENNLDAKFNESEELKMKVSKLMERVMELEEKNNAMKVENKELKKEISVKTSQEQQPTRQVANKEGIPVDVGFKFKGKKIVFIIDISGSMFNEDRIGQVKAGLKMLITSMGEDFEVDVVHFPNGNSSPYRPLWSSLTRMDKRGKEQVYGFLNGLRPYGSTPTREVLVYALQRYDTATDIVLLSDGAPTLSNSTKKDDIYDILREARLYNSRDVKISTIGVGSDFLRDQNNQKYIFLKTLAAEHAGFFVGF